jgi:hypothetical protein
MLSTRAAEQLRISQPALAADQGPEDERPGAVQAPPHGADLAGRRLVASSIGALRRPGAAAQAGTLRGKPPARSASAPGRPEFIRIGDLLSLAMRSIQQSASSFGMKSPARPSRQWPPAIGRQLHYGETTHPAVNRFPCVRSPAACRFAAWRERIALPDGRRLPRCPGSFRLRSHPQSAARRSSQAWRLSEQILEADNESVVSSLVKSGLGLALMREDKALDRAARNQVSLWGDTRLVTTLQFIYLRERESDPLINVLLGLLKDIWAAAPEIAA